jgi:small-conductance mechanosensitive channel
MTYFQSVDLARFISETPNKIWLQIQTPVFLAQLGGVLITGLTAYWLSRLIRGRLTRIALNWLPRSWGPGFIRGAQNVSMPVFWLAMLWIGALAGEDLGLPLPIVPAATDLVLAWICIRLLSLTVRSEAVSNAIAVVAWSVAALNILNLYRPLLGWLRGIHVYDGKQHHVTLLDTLNALVILIVLLWVTRLLYRVLQRQITHSQALTPSLQVLLDQLLQIFLPAIAIIIALQTIGLDLTTLTVTFGALGLGVGLGLQRLVANLVAGLALLMGKTIKPGDIIEYKNTYGWVTAMGARYVTLRTRDGVEHLIPNDYFLENGVENWSYSDVRLRLHVPVGISYDCDPHQAMAICVEAAKAVKRVIARPEPICVLKEFGESSVNLEIRFWIEDPRNGTTNVRSDVMLQVWDRFKEAGITLPYPRRDVRIVSMPESGEGGAASRI